MKQVHLIRIRVAQYREGILGQLFRLRELICLDSLNGGENRTRAVSRHFLLRSRRNGTHVHRKEQIKLTCGGGLYIQQAKAGSDVSEYILRRQRLGIQAG